MKNGINLNYMMKRITIFLITILFSFPAFSQREDFSYKFYGFVRGDLFYDSRANVTPVDGNFYLFPLEKSLDFDGKDLNATPSGSFYAFTTRLGMDIAGPMVGTARTSAKIETDFGGFSQSVSMLRIRQAYVALDWTHSQVLIGHTWHPLFGSVMPDILSLSTGAPFQPFNRSPQLRYQYKKGITTLTAATIWQLQYMSAGPQGKSQEYIKNSGIPELYAGVDFSLSKEFVFGAGIDMISLKPRIVSAWNNETYKVNERITAFSYEAHLKYTGRDFTVSAKSLLASLQDHSALLGGYGVSSINQTNGEQKYTAFRHSTSWLNITYGKKWKPSLMFGYSKNLGTGDELESLDKDKIYGLGMDIDQLFTINASLSYNLPHWRFGMEYNPATAWYGKICPVSGRIKDAASVTNHRILAVMTYFF